MATFPQRPATSLGAPVEPTRRRRRCTTQQPLDAARLPDALLNIKTVTAITALSTSTIYRRMAEGAFPAAIKLGPLCTRWRAGDVTAWTAAQAMSSEGGAL